MMSLSEFLSTAEIETAKTAKRKRKSTEKKRRRKKNNMLLETRTACSKKRESVRNCA